MFPAIFIFVSLLTGSNSQLCDGGTGTGILGDERFQYVLDALVKGHGFTMDSASIGLEAELFTGASIFSPFSDIHIPFVNEVTDYSVAVFADKQLASYLSVDDVIIWRVCLPPPITYYGVAGYSAAEVLSEDATVRNYKEASLGDSINNLNVKSDTGDAFNTPAFFVMSASQSSLDIVSGLVASSFDPTIAENINFIKVPNEVFSFAESSASLPRDTFSFLLRTVDNSNNYNPLYESYKAAEYIKPFFVFRKYIAESVGDFEFSEKPLEAETVENTPGKSRKFDEAVKGIIAYFGGLGLSLEDSYPMNGAANLYTKSAPPLHPLRIPVYIQNHGQTCLTADPLFPLNETNQNCICNNPDTYYSMFEHNDLREPFGFSAKEGEFYVVVGSNPNKYNMSVYNSIGIYNTLKATQTVTLSSVLSKAGESPKVYYPIGTVVNDDYANLKECGVFNNNKHNNVFAVQVAAEGNPFIVAGLNNMTISEPELSVPFVFMGRVHLNPQTGTRPKEEELIPWRILKFTPTNVDEAAMEWYVFPKWDGVKDMVLAMLFMASIVVGMCLCYKRGANKNKPYVNVSDCQEVECLAN